MESNDSAMEGQIVAMGGGGFSMEPENSLLDDFVLGLARRQPPRVCFLPTASGDSPAYIAKFYRAFSGRSVPTDLTLFGSPDLPRCPTDAARLPEFVAGQDIFYVGGGNTANLLALWRAHGLDTLLRDAWLAGAILCGISAGMICWFQNSITDSFGRLDTLDDGLGFLAGSACPHYSDEPLRRTTYHGLISRGFMAGHAADDGAALHSVGTRLAECVSSRREAGVYRLEKHGDAVAEVRLPVRFLGGSP